jgi:hypothetical protein
MSSNSSSYDGTSSFAQLIARILLDQVMNPPETRESLWSMPNRENPNAPENIRRLIIELSQQYNESIREYHTNVSQYNRNIDRIIHLLENAIGISPNTPEHRSNTHAYSTNVPSTSNVRTDSSYNVITDSSGVTITDNSGNRSRSIRYTRFGSPLINYYTNPLRNSTFTNFPYSSIYLNTSRIPNYTTINSILNHSLNNTRQEGLTEAQIQNATERVIYDESNNEMPTQCHITLDEFIHGEELLQIRQCKHMFKPPGLRRWLSQHSKCPVCRCDVTLNGIYENTPSAATEAEEPGEYDDMPELISVHDEEDTHDIVQADIEFIFQG